jgi:copper homeostasis protein
VTLVEICIEDIEGAFAAESSGADRIELCAGLAEGGITPAIGTVVTVLAGVRRIGVQVLIRPRAGDFVYSRFELDAMCADIGAVRDLGSPDGVTLGFVIGALTPRCTVDREAVKQLLEACQDAPVTFHKAFDATADIVATLDELAELGVGRVLTSGGRATAHDGASMLARLVERAAGRIEILAGGGIRPGNVVELVARTGVREVHLRAPVDVPSAAQFRNPELDYDRGSRTVTSGALVKDVVLALCDRGIGTVR